MLKVKVSSIMLSALFLLLCTILFLLRDTLALAHLNGQIDYVSSDGGNYYLMYQTLFSELSITDAPALALVGSPIVLLKLTGGTLWPIQLGQLILMALTLRVGSACLTTLRGRLAFMAGALAFPYFLFGFASLNKEIYAMCSAIFYVSYMAHGHRRHLLGALVLALCARYYMLLSLLALVLLVPRRGPPRYRLIVMMLVGVSLAAPFVKLLVPGYSGEDLIDGPTFTSVLFAKVIDNFGYALIYPVKYLVLIPTRAYSFLLDPTRLANGIEAVVSLLSLAALGLAAAIVLLRQPTSALVRRLILMAVVAPIPIMWTEIMHWRYFSFVYFFVLIAIVSHYMEPAPAARLSSKAPDA